MKFQFNSDTLRAGVQGSLLTVAMLSAFGQLDWVWQVKVLCVLAFVALSMRLERAK